MCIHTAPVDSYRHSYGIFNEKINKGIEETDAWIGQLMEAVESSGVKENTNLIVISDHGQIDIERIININVVFAEHGFIRTESGGAFADWDAYCLSNGASALVFLKDNSDRRCYERVHALLLRLCKEGIYGISRVFTEPEISGQEHLGGDFSFVLETDGYTAFGDDWNGSLVRNFDTSDYRYGRATHGYLPDKGPQPLLIAKGPGIKDGVLLEKARIVDAAPTFAKLLGFTMPDADGVSLDPILAAQGDTTWIS